MDGHQKQQLYQDMAPTSTNIAQSVNVYEELISQTRENLITLETKLRQMMTLLDDIKFMVSRTTDMVQELKALGNCSLSKDVKSQESCRITTLLSLFDQEACKMDATEGEGKRSGSSSKLVLLLHEILQLGEKELEVKGLLGGLESSLENLESLVSDLEAMRSRIANLKELKEERVKNCEKEVKETIRFGSEHESVIQTYLESMEEKMVDTYFESVKLKRKEWESRIRRRTNLPGVRIGHETNAAEKRAD